MQARQIQKWLLPALALFGLLVGGNLIYRRVVQPRRQAAAAQAPQRDARLASAILNFERTYPASGLRIAADSARIFKDQSWELQGVEVQARQKSGQLLTVRGRSAEVKQVQALEQGEVGRIELKGAVEVEREDGFKLHTESLTYGSREQVVRTRDPVRWSRANASGRGSGLRYDIDDEQVEILRDAEVTVRDVSPRPELRGDLAISARSLLLDLSGGRLRCEGDAVLSQGRTRLAAQWVEADLSSDLTRLMGLRAGSGVDAAFAGDAESGGRRLTSEQLEIVMAPDGDFFEQVNASGQARLVFEPTADRGGREIRAQQLSGSFYEGADALRRVEGSGGVELMLEPRRPGERPRQIQARRGWAELPLRGAADRIHLEGEVQFQGEGRRASGQTGELEGGTLTLTGKPVLIEEQRRIEAQTLEYDESTGVLRATGSVRVELGQSPNPELDLQGGPLLISAGRLEHDPDSGRAEFTGAVHTQRGDDALDADHLVLESKTSDFVADGNVRTAFGARGAAEPGARSEGGLFGGAAPSLFKSERLKYTDQTGLFSYSGQVAGIQGKDSIRADALELTRQGGRLDAQGKVFVVLHGRSIGPESAADGGRGKLSAKAEELRYRGAERTIVLNRSAELMQRGRSMSGQTIEVLLDADGEATEVKASGAVVLQGSDQKGTCDRLEYDVAADSFTLHGDEREATFYQLGQTAVRGRRLSLRGGEGRTVSLLPAEGARVRTLHYPDPKELPEPPPP